LKLFEKSTPEQQGAVVLENTGNEARRRRSQTPTLEEVHALRELLPIVLRAPDVVTFQNCMLAHAEDELYVKVYQGNDTLFFTHRADGRMEFGASPALLNRRYVVYHRQQAPVQGEEAAVLVDPLLWMECVRDGGGLWPVCEGAARVCALYQGLRAGYPSIQRVLMPPQDTEAEYMRRMHMYWGPIEEAQLSLGHELRHSRGVLVSVLRDHRALPPALTRWMMARVGRADHRREFMQSTLYQYFFD
jgi:hypothetical protein